MMKAKPLLAGSTLLALIVTGLIFPLGLGSRWTAGAQKTFIVNDDTIPTQGGCGTPDFQTEDIQKAVDSSLVADGDTLVICEGTYNPPDAIEVTKSLTIEGRIAANRDDIVVHGSSGSHGFIVHVDDVKIRHLKLVGPGTTGTDDGIRLESPGPITYDNAEFSDLEITNWYRGVYIGQSNDSAVGPDNHIHGNVTGVVIEGGPLGGRRDRVFNSVIGPNQAQGITLGQSDETYIERNILGGNTTQIHVGASTAFIWNNEIEATTSDGIRSDWSPADNLVQIGGSPSHANNFTGSLVPGFFYVYLDCDAESTVDATFNYWNGISSSAGISAVVFNDEYDDPWSPAADCPGNDKGAVVVHPWLARTVDLSPPGWHSLAWSGADGTDPAAALACISGKYSIAYAWEGPSGGFTRYLEGCPVDGICTMAPLNRYDSLLVLVTAEGVTCDMPVVPEVTPGPGADGSGAHPPPHVEPPPPATLITASGEQTSGVYDYCWKGLCVDMLGVTVPADAVAARADEPLTFELVLEPTQLYLLAWPLDSGTVVKEYEGFFAWRAQGEPTIRYELPAERTFQFTPDLPPGRYVIVLAVYTSDAAVGYGFQLELVP